MSARDIAEELLFQLGDNGDQKQPIYQFLDIDGDGSGLSDANGNYVISGTEIFLLPTTSR